MLLSLLMCHTRLHTPLYSFAMYGDLTDPIGIEEQACMPRRPNILMGQLGLSEWFLPADSRQSIVEQCHLSAQQRRSLAATVNATAMASAAVDAHLLYQLLDTVATLALLMLIASCVQAAVAILYATCVNKKYYGTTSASTSTSTTPERRGKQKSPLFRGLPGILVFPYLQLLLCTTMATGMMETSTSVYGTSTVYSINGGLAAFACVTFACVFLFLATQLHALVRFHRTHAKAVWAPAETAPGVSSMDDPILRLLARLRLTRPCMRLKGEYAPSEEATAEPGRTERALCRVAPFPLSLFLKPKGGRKGNSAAAHSTPGATNADEAAADQLEELEVWLGGGSGGSLRGVLFSVVVMMLQLLVAICISAYRVLGEEHEWAKQASLWLVCALQLAMAVWNVAGDPADRLSGLVACVVSLIEFVATCLILASRGANGLGSRGADGLGAAASSLLMTSVFLPMGLSVYDMLLMPVVTLVQQRLKSGEPMGKALLGTLCIALTLPITLAMAVFGISFKGADAAMAVAERETTRIGERVKMREAREEEDATADGEGGIALPSALHKHTGSPFLQRIPSPMEEEEQTVNVAVDRSTGDVRVDVGTKLRVTVSSGAEHENARPPVVVGSQVDKDLNA